MATREKNRIAARSVGATMILLSVFMTWLFVPSPGAVLFPLWAAGILGWVGILNVILGGNPTFGIPGADPLALVLTVIFAAFSLILVVAGGITALIPTKIATKIGRRSKSVSVGGGILSLIGVGLFVGFLQVNIFSFSSLTYGLGFYVAILGSILVIASAAIPKEKEEQGEP